MGVAYLAILNYNISIVTFSYEGLYEKEVNLRGDHSNI